MERWIALLGLVVIMALAWLIGDRNRKVNYRIIGGGLLLQFALALFILKTPVGVSLFQGIGVLFTAILGFTDAGSIFVLGKESSHHFIAFRVLPTIIFVSSVMSVLYYLGVLQKIIWAIAWLMGIPWSESLRAGELLGTKMALNEFIAYAKLAEWSAPGSEVVLSERTRTILTYALCGFANFGSIGIQIGGIGGIAPERRLELARLAMPAMLGGTFAMMMTACVAGLLI